MEEVAQPRAHVLLVEKDTDAIWNLTFFLLEIEHCSVQVYRSAEEALENAPGFKPDIIVYGHAFSRRDSLELLSEIRTKSPPHHLIVTLAEEELELASTYVKLGARGCICRNQKYIASLRKALKEALIEILWPASAHSTNDVEGLLPASISAFRPGTNVLHYQILEEVSEGEVSAVYKAEDLQRGQTVAIKTLPSMITMNARTMKRLIRELEILSTIRHPNIAEVYAIEETSDFTFIVTEFVEGESFSALIRREPISLPVLLEIGAQVADALDAAHSIGLVHRDINPENIIVTQQGVKLLNFGFDKRVTASPIDVIDDNGTLSRLIHPSASRRMAQYMSPEQVRGEEVDVHTDVFSLGSLLYEAVTGSLPFTGPDAPSVMLEILAEDPPLPSTIHSDLLPEFDAIMQDVLAKDKNRRLSASDFSYVLRRLKATLLYTRPARHDASTEKLHDSKTPPAPVRSYRRYIKAAALILPLLFVPFFITFQSISPNSGLAKPSLVIAPFVNFRADPRTQYLASGMTEILLERLSEIPNLHVTNSLKQNHSKGSTDLSAAATLKGSILQNGDLLHIQVDLMNQPDGSVLWTRRYRCTIAELPDVQTNILTELANVLGLRLTVYERERLTRDITTNAQAYQQYLKGRFYLNGKTEKELRSGLESFQKATNLDPQFALAHAGSAEAWILLAERNFAPRIEAFPRAAQEAVLALELKDHLPEAHMVLGMVKLYYDWDLPGAVKEFQRTVALQPRNPRGRCFLALALAASESTESALAEIQQALELDTASVFLNIQYASLLVQARKFDEAVEQSQRTLKLQRNLNTHLILGDAYFGGGKYKEAMESYREAHRLGSTNALIKIATIQAALGRHVKARMQLEKVEKETPPFILRPYFMAAAYATLGEKEEALEWLEKGWQMRCPDLILLKNHFVFDSLRSDLQFQQYLHRTGMQL